MPPETPTTPNDLYQAVGRIEGALSGLVEDVKAIRADQQAVVTRVGGLERSRSWARGAAALLATGAGALGWEHAQAFLLK